MVHPALDRMEQDRARTTALLASGLASTFAVNHVIYETPRRQLALGLLREGTGLSPRRTSEPTLDSLVLGPDERRRHYPKNLDGRG